MKMNISHPYKDNISLSFDQFTQIVGQDQQLKYYIWQILLWYFGGKKYSEEDLVLFEQNEPKILIDDTMVSRSEFSVIQVSNINDLIEQMEYKKGTVAYDYIKKKINSIEIMEQIENINDNLDRISLLLNQKLNLQIDDIIYHTEAKYFNTNQLIQKNSEMLKISTIETARENERGIIDLETLQKTQKDLIETLEETLKIQQEGRARRRKAEVELTNMEEDLRQKLLVLSHKEKQIHQD